MLLVTFVGSIGTVSYSIGHQRGADATRLTAQTGELRRQTFCVDDNNKRRIQLALAFFKIHFSKRMLGYYHYFLPYLSCEKQKKRKEVKRRRIRSDDLRIVFLFLGFCSFISCYFFLIARPLFAPRSPDEE